MKRAHAHSNSPSFSFSLSLTSRIHTELRARQLRLICLPGISFSRWFAKRKWENENKSSSDCKLSLVLNVGRAGKLIYFHVIFLHIAGRLFLLLAQCCLSHSSLWLFTLLNNSQQFARSACSFVCLLALMGVIIVFRQFSNYRLQNEVLVCLFVFARRARFVSIQFFTFWQTNSIFDGICARVKNDERRLEVSVTLYATCHQHENDKIRIGANTLTLTHTRS